MIAGEGVQDAEVQERRTGRDEDQIKHGEDLSARCVGSQQDDCSTRRQISQQDYISYIGYGVRI